MHRQVSSIFAAAVVMGFHPTFCIAQSLPQFNIEAAETKCANEWTSRGVRDDRMYNYCMERQNDGYEEAIDLVGRYATVPLLSEIIQSAEETWLKPHDYQYEMLAYEIEREGEAYLDVQYAMERGIYTEQQLIACSQRWLIPTEPQWTMVAYCLEND